MYPKPMPVLQPIPVKVQSEFNTSPLCELSFMVLGAFGGFCIGQEIAYSMFGHSYGLHPVSIASGVLGAMIGDAIGYSLDHPAPIYYETVYYYI